MKRSTAIDMLRALAVMLVIGRHSDLCPAQISPHLNWLTSKWETGGWVGVDLFFVLSGFLVSGLLFREQEKYGGISVKTFLIRRGFKIYPAFWLLIIISVAVFKLNQVSFKPLAVASEFLFVQNYLPALWNHTWSLAVEEHFYFFLVILLFLLLKLGGRSEPFRAVPLLFCGLALCCLVLRLMTANVSPVFIAKTQVFPTHLRMDSLFFGVLISYFYHTRPNQFMAWARRWRWGLLPAGLILLAPAFGFALKWHPWIYTGGFTLFYLGGGCLLIFMLAIRVPENVLSKTIAYVGSHSYSIYLWHVPVAAWIVPWLLGPKQGRNWFVYFATYVLGSILIGIVMAIIIEFPILRWRERLVPSRSRPLSTS